MTAHATTAIRELGGEELDQVTGGLNYNPSETTFWMISAGVIGAMFTTALAGLLEWLFG